MTDWIVCQLGARENYAVPRALERRGVLDTLVTDIWPRNSYSFKYFSGRLAERFHPDLSDAHVVSSTTGALLFELNSRVVGLHGWDKIIKRNKWFQNKAAYHVARSTAGSKTVFAYSYSAAKIFEAAKERGWTTVLGQIDPGPAEARLVEKLNQEQSEYVSHKQAPEQYWENWRVETELADHIVVNSDWTKKGLIEEGVSPEKINVIPLALENYFPQPKWVQPGRFDKNRPLRLLFLGQVNLRKGIDIVFGAMRKCSDLPLQLDIVGPLQTSVPESARNDVRIIFHGNVKRSEVSNFFSKADLFLFPSRSDGFGLTQLEAVRAGVPIIASQNCGSVVFEGRNGLLLDEISADSLAGVLAQLSSSPNQVCTLRNATSLDKRFNLVSLGTELLSLSRKAPRNSICT